MTKDNLVELSHAGADFTGIEQPQTTMLAAEVALQQIASREIAITASVDNSDSVQLLDDLNNGHYDTV